MWSREQGGVERERERVFFCFLLFFFFFFFSLFFLFWVFLCVCERERERESDEEWSREKESRYMLVEVERWECSEVGHEFTVISAAVSSVNTSQPVRWHCCDYGMPVTYAFYSWASSNWFRMGTSYCNIHCVQLRKLMRLIHRTWSSCTTAHVHPLVIIHWLISLPYLYYLHSLVQ